MKLSILGPPGSGKTTQSERISKRCGLIHIYAGDLLRRESRTNSPFAERIRAYLRAGKLVPSDIVLYLIEKALSHTHGGYVLDGFPRTMEQALELEFLLKERGEKLDAVIYLVIDDEEVYRRLLARGRPDDTPPIIAERIRIFHEETDPVLDFFDEMGILIAVSGEGSPDQVTDRVLGALMAGASLGGRNS